MFLKVVFFLVVPVTFVSTQDEPSECLKPFAFGDTCGTAKPSVQWHFDNATKLCMAFKYNGCGGSKNRFESYRDCENTCLPLGRNLCPANTESFNTSCKSDTDCPAKGYCKKAFGGGGKCCKSETREKFDSDYNGSCDAARQVIRINEFAILMGKSCASNFCPVGADCKEGNFFATCCDLKK